MTNTEQIEKNSNNFTNQEKDVMLYSLIRVGVKITDNYNKKKKLQKGTETITEPITVKVQARAIGIYNTFEEAYNMIKKVGDTIIKMLHKEEILKKVAYKEPIETNRKTNNQIEYTYLGDIYTIEAIEHKRDKNAEERVNNEYKTYSR